MFCRSLLVYLLHGSHTFYFTLYCNKRHTFVGGAVLLRAHFDRLHGPEEGPVRLAAFMKLLREKRMAVSFEILKW
jgi:hypothetical protein